MKKWLRKYVPTQQSVKKMHEFKILKPLLTSSIFWSFDHHAVARGVAAGLAGAVIPGFQLFYALLLVILLRGNIPIALCCTLVTNPFTVLPIMLSICFIGSFVMGNGTSECVFHHFEWDVSSFHVFWSNVSAWMLQFGKAFLIGVPIASFGLGAIGYVGTMLAWKMWMILIRKNDAEMSSMLLIDKPPFI